MPHIFVRGAGRALAAMGMDKSGAQTIANTSVWEKLTGWVARSGFPLTVISGDGLQANGVGVWNLQVQSTHDNTSGETRVRVLRNGVVLTGGTFTASGTFHTTVGGTISSVAVAVGDVFTVEVYRGSLSGNQISAGSGTFLAATLV